MEKETTRCNTGTRRGADEDKTGVRPGEKHTHI